MPTPSTDQLCARFAYFALVALDNLTPEDPATRRWLYRTLACARSRNVQGAVEAAFQAVEAAVAAKAMGAADCAQMIVTVGQHAGYGVF